MEEGSASTPSSGHVWMIFRPGCRYCVLANKILLDLLPEFQKVNCVDHPKVLELLRGFTDQRTVPQIFLNNEWIGGFSELEGLREEDEEGLRKRLIQCLKQPYDGPLWVKELWTTFSGKKKEQRNLEEADFLQLMMRSMYQNVPLTTKRRGLIKHSRVVCGGDLLHFVSNEQKQTEFAGYLHLRPEVVADSLVRDGFIYRLGSRKKRSSGFDPSSSYLFARDRDPWILNSFRDPRMILEQAVEAKMSAEKLAEEIRNQMAELHDAFISDDGVDYSALAKSSAFSEFERLTLNLHHVNLKELNNDQKKAFFMNIYNAIVIHAFCVNGCPSSILAKVSLFSKASYNIGGLRFSANDIENGILRGNRRPPGKFSAVFKKSDPRLAFAFADEDVDARLHFALNCGAKSCPPIQVFNGKNIEMALNMAATSFILQDLEIDAKNATIRVSKIFQWYAEDFGKGKDLVRYIAQYLPGSHLLVRLVRSDAIKKLTVKYKKYDWEQNDSKSFFEEKQYLEEDESADSYKGERASLSTSSGMATDDWITEDSSAEGSPLKRSGKTLL